MSRERIPGFDRATERGMTEGQLRFSDPETSQRLRAVNCEQAVPLSFGGIERIVQPDSGSAPGHDASHDGMDRLQGKKIAGTAE